MNLLRLLTFLAGVPAVWGQTVSLTVNATQSVRTVDERVFGVNAVTWDNQTSSAQTISLLKAAGFRAIRLPGGSAADGYHWLTSPSSTQGAGFNTFTSLITGLAAQTFVTVDYGSGTIQEAAAWVAYANAASTLSGTAADVPIGVDAKGFNWQTAGFWSNLRNSAPLAKDDGMNFLRVRRASPFALKYWEIGNECYGSWETDTHQPPWDPVTYATFAKQAIALMKTVDPTIKVGVVAETGEDSLDGKSPVHPVTNPVTGATHHGWTPVLLHTLKAAPAVTPDFLVYHRYEQGPGGESDAGLLQKARTWPNDAANLRSQLNNYLGTAAGSSVELDVTENNSVYSNPGKQTTSLVNALYFADSVGNILQTEFNSLIWWDLRNGQENSNNNNAALYGWRNYGDYGIMTASSQPYPTYYAMKLLANFVRGGDMVVTAASTNSLLSVFAVRHAAGSLGLLVINKDPVNPLTASLGLVGFTPAGTASTFAYGKPQDTASTDLVTGTMNVGGSTFTASFPSYSVTVLSLPPAVAPVLTLAPAGVSVITGTTATFSPVATGTPAPAWQWQRLPAGGSAWSPLAAGGATYAGVTTPTLSVAGANMAMNGDQFRCVVSNVGGSVISTPVTLVVQPPTYTSWAGAMGLAAANAAPSAAPFPDSLPNLVRYAMNLGSAPAPGQLPVLTPPTAGGSQVAALQYRQRKGLVGVQLSVQSSPDLVVWTAVPAAAITALADDDANTARFQAVVPIPANGRVFLRAVAAQTP